jgi:hypothetical protein
MDFNVISRVETILYMQYGPNKYFKYIKDKIALERCHGVRRKGKQDGYSTKLL